MAPSERLDAEGLDAIGVMRDHQPDRGTTEGNDRERHGSRDVVVR
jgi:hypothetical protein